MRRHKREVVKRSVAALSPWGLGHALGIAGAIFLFVAAFMSWVSSYYNANLIAAQFPISFSVYSWTLIFGLIEVYVFGYVLGLIIARFYNGVLR